MLLNYHQRIAALQKNPQYFVVLQYVEGAP